MYNYLLDQESIILAGYDDGSITRFELRNNKHTKIGKFNKYNNRPSYNKKSNFKPKYCKFHQMKGHTDQECYSQKKGPSFTNENNDHESYAFVESPVEVAPLELEGTVLNRKMNVLIDSGSKHNYIESEIVKELQIGTTKTNEMKMETADGRNVQIDINRN